SDVYKRQVQGERGQEAAEHLRNEWMEW
ncbi:hypothetical protein MX747_17310, partial [Klebsiella pneumoniae]|nr:hypothetical protein [Klebsiella pneumoniae]